MAIYCDCFFGRMHACVCVCLFTCITNLAMMRPREKSEKRGKWSDVMWSYVLWGRKRTRTERNAWLLCLFSFSYFSGLSRCCHILFDSLSGWWLLIVFHTFYSISTHSISLGIFPLPKKSLHYPYPPYSLLVVPYFLFYGIGTAVIIRKSGLLARPIQGSREKKRGVEVAIL